MASNITSAWLAVPANSASAGGGNEVMQDIKDTFRVRIAREHYLSTAAASPQVRHGAHLPGSAVDYFQSAAPTLRPDGATTLNVDDAGRKWIDSDTLLAYVLRWTGSATEWVPVAPSHGLVLLTSGDEWTATITGPVKVTCVGGGGGGGGVNTGGSCVAGGGGAGAMTQHIYNVVKGTAYTVAIGAAGAGGTAGANAGAAGGATTFTDGATLCSAGGGAGGEHGGYTYAPVLPALGGVASGGTINVNGCPGAPNAPQPDAGFAATYHGKGGDTLFGTGGVAGILSFYRDAIGYGAGGRGAATFSSANVAGGAGTAGAIVIEW